MANPRAFISFDFDHNELQRNLFVGQSKNSRTPFSIEDWSSKSSLPQSQWERLIEEKIKKCNMLIVLVGRNMSSATGVIKEIEMASRNSVPVFGVYVDGAGYSTPIPINLPRSRVIAWEWDKIASKVNEMMTQGKNWW